MAVNLRKSVREVTPKHLMTEEEATAFYSVQPSSRVSSALQSELESQAEERQKRIELEKALQADLAPQNSEEQNVVAQNELETYLSTQKSSKREKSVPNNANNEHTSFSDRISMRKDWVFPLIWGMFCIVFGTFFQDILSFLAEMANSMAEETVLELTLVNNLGRQGHILLQVFGTLFLVLGGIKLVRTLFNSFRY